jgi:hypothetical protein
MRNCAIIHPLHLELETAAPLKGVAKAALYCAHPSYFFLLSNSQPSKGVRSF